MQITAHDLTKSRSASTAHDLARSVSLKLLETNAKDWIFDAEFRQHSQATLDGKRNAVEKLLWFLNHRNFTECGVSELRQFLAYVGNGHKEPGGRWGNPHCRRPVGSRTVEYYYVYLQGLFNWMVQEAVIPASPLERINKPAHKDSLIQPFTREQMMALLKAARGTDHPRRNEAIVMLLADTGIRATELCSLRMRDVDAETRRCTVTGKGNKVRFIYFGRASARALYQYLQEIPRESDSPLFQSDGGSNVGGALTRSGLLQLVKKLGEKANIRAMRCSPHSFRHTFAVEFLRAGGNVFSLQQLMGHSSLHQTQKYVALAQADLANQHRQFSPGDRLVNLKCPPKQMSA